MAGSDIDEQVDPTEWGNYVRKSQDSLRVLAEETGGSAVVNMNDFDKALKQIDAASERLLRARLLLEQSRPDEAAAGNRREDPARERGRVLAQGIRAATA